MLLKVGELARRMGVSLAEVGGNSGAFRAGASGGD
ncbi:Uncharacterised protein [Serratia marcescens]|nr:Uncharacterised protein [Serratia marcescens]